MILQILYTQVLYPLAWLGLLLASPLFLKIRLMVKARMKPIVVPARIRRPIWVHCASGEFEYAIPVIERLKATHPEIPIVVSYTSPSYADRVRSHPSVDFAFPLPWDFAAKTREILRKIQPRAVLVARTDFWPQFLLSCRRLKIPTVAFSVRTHGQFSWAQRQVMRFQLRSIDRVYTVDQVDQQRLQSLGLPALALGDSRWDRVFSRLESASKTHPLPVVQIPVAQKPLAVFGSTWPADDRVLLDSVRDFCQPAQIAWVPHEIAESQLQSLTTSLTARGLQVKRLSSFHSNGTGGRTDTNNWDVLLVDRFGLLAELYRQAFLAFVGGSFSRQVHSVMEPLAAGCRVIFGPKHERSPEALEALRDHTAKAKSPWVRTVASSYEFAQAFQEALNDLKDRPAARLEISDWAQTRRGASLRIMAQLVKDLPPEAFQ